MSQADVSVLACRWGTQSLESADGRERRGSPRGCEHVDAHGVSRVRFCWQTLSLSIKRGANPPRARHASISGASRPALLSLCPFSKCFFGTPPPATPCDISPARMLLLTPRSCGSWFPDPRPLRASPSSCHFPLGRPLLGAPPSLAELSRLCQRPLSSRVSFYWLLPSARCALQTCPQIL